jgi:ribosomal protein S18 acetylase RimI-like enzyme
VVKVRPVTPADFAAVGEITVAAYLADGQLADENRYEERLRDVAGRAATNEVLVAVDDETGEPVGAVTFVLPGSDLVELSGPDEAEFRMLAVAPHAQGRGVGEALVRACVARAVERSCTAVVICTRDFSAPAHRLYQRLGFVRVPELDWEPLPSVRLLGLRLRLDPPATT